MVKKNLMYREAGRDPLVTSATKSTQRSPGSNPPPVRSEERSERNRELWRMLRSIM